MPNKAQDGCFTLKALSCQLKLCFAQLLSFHLFDGNDSIRDVSISRFIHSPHPAAAHALNYLIATL
jgi:hypothetical protein